MGKRVFCLLACLLLIACCSAGACAAEPGGMATTLSAVKPEMIQPDGYEQDFYKSFPRPRYRGVESRLIMHEVKDALEVKQWCPVFGNAALDKAVSASLKGRLSGFLEKDKAFAGYGNGEEGPSRSWWKGTYRLFSSGPGCVTVHFSSYVCHSYNAHGATLHKTLVFSEKRGRLLGLGDLFADANMAVRLMSQWATKKLSAALGESFFSNGVEPKPENFTRLIPVRDGLVMVFPEYQAAPFGMGAQVVKMPLNALEKTGPKPEVWGARH
ncbi:MAG: DUF3298 domain-containing protein [Desulfovibrionaceae bacterium]|nr:DUF3298 domain-containing protein [Desulfovibrionaceae bacterium]